MNCDGLREVYAICSLVTVWPEFTLLMQQELVNSASQVAESARNGKGVPVLL